ncbi:molecular chaperone GrpE [Haloactinospora alba]|uniref:Protein GrpE n=1 Tax=Haloactinospora alba TaxID=405555 RepID=A0A543NAL1_9ACTN|nr:nucleotide exchange factor GrpE [Haloactinospora alba]TQN28826.1 molecular chaperone GrpE [Haloactinospora alba]
MSSPENDNGEEPEGPVVRDKRRVDPETGELRETEGGETADEPVEEQEQPLEAEVVTSTADAEVAELQQQLTDRTNDLKRLQAEYANYRKRVERERESLKEQALAQVVGDLLPILDDIGRAREYDELTGGFKSVGESLESLVTKLGLKKYAEQGDEFDPNVHEALTMVPSADVTVPTVVEVFQPGYLIGERVLRPARVVVAGPGEDTPEGSGTDQEEAPAQEADSAEAPPKAGNESEQQE